MVGDIFPVQLDVFINLVFVTTRRVVDEIVQSFSYKLDRRVGALQ